MILRSVDHSMRQRILEFIEEEGPVKVTDIFIFLRVDQAVASQHLAKLRRAKVVTTQRFGKFVEYSLNYKTLERIRKACSGFAENTDFSKEYTCTKMRHFNIS